MTAVDLGVPRPRVLDYDLEISNSEIQTAKSCRRRWMLSYYMQRGLVRSQRQVTGHMMLGNRIHAALEQYYEKRVDLIKAINSIYEAELASDILFDDQKVELRKEWELARIMLEGYLDHVSETGADEGLEFLAAEETIAVPMAETGVTLKGKLDARVRRTFDGAHLFMDHKTVGALTGPQITILSLDEQMLTYCLLEYLDALMKTGGAPPEPTDGGLYNMLRRVKRTERARPPFYDRIEVRHNQQSLQSTWLRIHAVIREIIDMRRRLDAGEDHRYVAYPRPSRDCTWACPFLAICPMMDDGSRWQDMLDEYYEIVNPYARYEQKKGSVSES